MTPTLRATPQAVPGPRPPRTSTALLFRRGYKYQLAETAYFETGILGYSIRTEFIKLDADGLLTIRKGYAWDGPSGPTVDTLNFMRGSLLHDAIYQLIRLGLIDRRYKAHADELLHQLCLGDNMSRFRAWYVYRAVSAAGDSSTRPSAERPVLRAP